MKIIKKIKKAAPLQIDSLIMQDYISINLCEYMQDSWVENVFLHKKVIQSINNWVSKSLEHASVSEVGGFILGRFAEKESLLYSVSLEDFCPAENIDFSSANLLDFGSQALIDLDRKQQELKELSLIAWFHTHPGHTPFLSDLDLHLHHGFFKQPYQLAIVLDSLTENHDTGFFSLQTKNPNMNNKKDFKKWVSWKTLI